MGLFCVPKPLLGDYGWMQGGPGPAVGQQDHLPSPPDQGVIPRSFPRLNVFKDGFIIYKIHISLDFLKPYEISPVFSG